MTRTLRNLLLFIFTGLSGSAFAQEIGGRVLDEKKEPLPSAVVQVYQGGTLRGGNVTDYDGNYTVKPLEPGTYDVLVLYSGYDSILVQNVRVNPGATTPLNFNMKLHTVGLTGVTVTSYKIPLIEQGSTSRKMGKEEIKNIPTTEVSDLVALQPGTYQQKRGSDISFGGARSSGTLYIIDGVQVQGTVGTNMSQGSIEQIEVITSGIPANYGDVSGGVVNITSRGVSQKMTGQVRLQHSIDGYNNNLANFSIAGPLLKKRVDSTHKKPVLGFALSGDYYNDKNRYPTYDQQYVTKGDVLNRLQKNPLRIINDNSGNPVYNYASNYITYDSLEKVKITPHNATVEARLNGKLDYQVTENMRIAAGGTFGYTKQDLYSRARILFAPEATPNLNTISGRGYLRFTQKFGKSNDTSANHSIISNAFYKVQADYQLVHQDVSDPKFGNDIFKYGYNGKFIENRVDNYATSLTSLGTDSLSGKKGTVLYGTSSQGIAYERSELNPNLANYTTQYYNYQRGNLPLAISEIQAKNGLANGDEPKFTYGMFYSPGATQFYYQNFNSSQYALTVDASFDLLAGKTKHAIEFGLYYQQRVERNYVVYSNPGNTGTNSLWSLMRGLVSSQTNGNLKLDKQNPIFLINGVQYKYSKDPVTGNELYYDPSGVAKNVSPTSSDTIIYNYKNIGTSTFDTNLRKKLGFDRTKNINIDAYDPSTFSLSMFSADELLHSGNPFVTYQGYTYTGAEQGNVNFNDFWTAKDRPGGNYTRPIGAFSPNYIAGYLLDRFEYKDIHFNVGVRVERYSANTKVLKDPFSLYAEKTVGQVDGSLNQFNQGNHPGNIGKDYVVYVDDNSSTSPGVIGYRSGNNWYDPTGKYIESPATLKQFSGGRDPQPFLVKDATGNTPKITDTGFNANNSFTDYTPQVNVMPRVSFSFPISDVANFYAHYDIYVQRPTGGINATAYDYFFLAQNAQGTINNPNLKPQKTFDYEVGFQQKLTKSSALTITAFYKERKDMITVVPLLYAYPTTYYSYGNRDFSTTKGTTLLYDLRATNHLTMGVSYTLQFAEGTGSSPTSGRGLLGSLVDAGLPNLRYVTAADFDSRHNIIANIDYRFNDGEGPTVGKSHIFQNAGVHVIARGRSGEPYTRYTSAQGNTVMGGVNGSRLPWHYGVDLRLDKDFSLAFGSKQKNAPEGIKPKKPMFVKAILQINNLLNTREILGVYGYTGKADDNGYLSSTFGAQYVPQQTNPQSYTDLYKIQINNPYNLNYARTISLALEFNF